MRPIFGTHVFQVCCLEYLICGKLRSVNTTIFYNNNKTKWTLLCHHSFCRVIYHRHNRMHMITSEYLINLDIHLVLIESL
jgi:hypothetical protein